MVNPKQQGEREGISRGVWSFLDRNWQIVAVVLAVVAIFVWYQALNLGTNVQKALNDVSKGIKNTTSSLTPVAPKATAPTAGATTPTPQAAPGSVFTQTAAKGQGVTHLSRQALEAYLATVKPQVNLTREHKIYIEDFLKDQKVNEIKRLSPGQKVNFSADSIQQGIELAQKLTPNQLHNLTKYANRVSGLKAYASSK